MTRSFEEETRREQAELDRLVQEMEGQRQDFLSETADFLRTWYWGQAEATAESEASVTKALAEDDRLSEFKVEVESLQDNASAVVLEFLGDDNLWWHRQSELRIPSEPHPESTYLLGRGPTSRPIDKAVRLAAGRLAPLLKKYGYKASSAEWRRSQGAQDALNGGAEFRMYALDVRWPAGMVASLKQYSQLLVQAVQVARVLRDSRYKEEMREARKLWDSA